MPGLLKSKLHSQQPVRTRASKPAVRVHPEGTNEDLLKKKFHPTARLPFPGLAAGGQPQLEEPPDGIFNLPSWEGAEQATPHLLVRLSLSCALSCVHTKVPPITQHLPLPPPPPPPQTTCTPFTAATGRVAAFN